MSNEHSQEALRRHIRAYMIVFGALLVGTVLTVWASKIDFGTAKANITIALVIACVKAFLVAGFFMHLISEKKAIYAMLITTGVFFLALMFLTIWSMYDYPVLTGK